MPNGVQEIYSKTGIISKYLLHKTYRCAKLYSKIWALKLKNITFAPTIVLWCNGSTTVFGSVSGGSNPPGTTQKIRGFFMILRIF